jgi:hypothetical protein
MRRSAPALLLSGAPAFWLAAAIATLFAGPQYARHYVDLRQDQRASSMVGMVVVGAVVVMMAAAVTGILVAVRGTTVTTRVFVALAGVVAVVVLLVGAPGGVAWHARMMTGTAVLTLLLLATAVAFASSGAGGATESVAADPADPADAADLADPADPAGPGDPADPADSAAPPPPRELLWRSLARRDVPRWAVALAAAVAVAFAITAGLLGVRRDNLPEPVAAGPTAGPTEPPHDVIYMVTAPSGVTWLEIVYSDEFGKDQRVSPSTGGPAPWVQPLRTGPDTDQLYLAVSIASPTRTLKIQCAIFIDGKRAIASEGPSCNVHVRLSR